MKKIVVVIFFVIASSVLAIAQKYHTDYWNAEILELLSKSDKSEFNKLSDKRVKADKLMIFADDSYQEISELRETSDQTADDAEQRKLLTQALTLENAAIQSRKEA